MRVCEKGVWKGCVCHASALQYSACMLSTQGVFTNAFFCDAHTHARTHARTHTHTRAHTCEDTSNNPQRYTHARTGHVVDVRLDVAQSLCPPCRRVWLGVYRRCNQPEHDCTPQRRGCDGWWFWWQNSCGYCCCGHCGGGTVVDSGVDAVTLFTFVCQHSKRYQLVAGFCVTRRHRNYAR